jgi:hypothetical protein
MRRDPEVGALVLVQTPAGWAGFTPAELAEAVERARAILPRPAAAATAAPERLCDAGQLGELTGIPGSWWAEQARQGTVPHLKIGRYIRFRANEVLACAKFRERDRC